MGSGVAVDTGFQPSLAFVRRVSPAESRAGGQAGGTGWLGQVVRGYLAHHAVPTNSQAITSFVHYATWHWKRALGRRSQKGPRDLDTLGAARRALAAARQGPAPVSAATLHRQTPEVGAECVSSARSDLFGGRGVTRVPTGMGRPIWRRACAEAKLGRLPSLQRNGADLAAGWREPSGGADRVPI